MSRPSWAPEGIDLDRPHEGRVYDYYLGGAHNFGPDRELAQQALAIEPHLRLLVRANRAFLRRVVRFMVGCGITQFIDLGSGIPTAGNVHEVAQHAHPDARVVYVDIDPVAVAHCRAILAGDEKATVLRADVREPARILADPEVRRVIDLDRPVGVLLLAVLPFVDDAADPAGIVAQLRDAIVPGSYIALSHGTREGRPRVADHEALYERSGLMIRLRTRSEIEPMLAGLDLVDPGLVVPPLWHPDDDVEAFGEPERSAALVALGRKVS